MYVYASSLEYELNAGEIIKANIKAGVNYKVLYFHDGGSEFQHVKELYEDTGNRRLSLYI